MSWVGPALGVAQFLTGLNAQKKQEKMANEQLKLQKGGAADQKEMFQKFILPALGAILPGFQALAPQMAGIGGDAATLARGIDPSKETADATRAYDVGARESLSRDLNQARLPLSMRGLKGSSEDSTFTGNVLARRAGDRANFVSGLRLGEPGRKLGYLGQAGGIGLPIMQSMNPSALAQGGIGAIQGANQTAGNMAQFHYGQAGQINPMAGLQGINWGSILKRKPSFVGNGSSGGGQGQVRPA